MTRSPHPFPDRRRWLLALAASLASPSLLAQARLGMVRIGYMPAGPDLSDQTWLNLLRRALSDLGYAEGRNLTLLIGRPDGTPAGMKAAVAQMVAQQPHLIITFGNDPVIALKRAAIGIPIVMTFATDPLGEGLVTNLSRPGGMVTGSTSGWHIGLFTKQLHALRAMLPKLTRVMVLTSGHASDARRVKAIAAVGKPLGLTVRGYATRDREQLASAFAAAKREKSAILVWGDYPFSWMRQQVGEYSLVHKVPVVAVNRGYIDYGALLSVGVSPKLQFEMAARYADRILSGAKPGDMPVEIPSTTEWVINAATAAAIGVPLSKEIRLRVDVVIESSDPLAPASH
jgi:putative ABC transport system substrate-binding protein